MGHPYTYIYTWLLWLPTIQSLYDPNFLGNYIHSCVSCFAIILSLPILAITIFHRSLSSLPLHNHKFTIPLRFSVPAAMKNSPSSICRLLVLIIVFLLLFVTSSASGTLSNPTLHETSSRNSHNHHHHHLYHSCGSLSSEKSRSLCIKLQRIHQHQTLPPPSPSQLDEIDPRYGVEKRLVPSGPNPLHNW